MKYIMHIVPVIAALALSATPAAAFNWSFSKDDSNAQVERDLEAQLMEGIKQVPLPAIRNWTERRAVQYLYELRDDPDFTTYSYLMIPMTGKFVLLCNSVGFGINASIQMANPEAIVSMDLGQYSGQGTLPQAEPNGLFMPEGLAATYVMCVNEEEETIAPMYVEPELIVSPFPLPDNLVVNSN